MSNKIPEPDVSPAMQRILSALARKPNMAASDLADEAFVGLTTLACGGYISVLRKRGLIFISGWRKVNGRFTTPLYSGGTGVDVPRPRIDETNRDAPGMHRILEVLREFGPLTYREIAHFSGLSANTVKNSGFLNALIAQKRIHIGGWRHALNGPMSPVYHLGEGLPVDKPQPVTTAEKCRQHRARSRIRATTADDFIAQLATVAQTAR